MAETLKYDNPALAYDAAELVDDEVMLSGPATGVPVSWPNPGSNDTWDGPYGTRLVEWTNASHPGADPTQGGWVPPNKALKYDSSIPDGWYTRISRKDKYSKRSVTVDTTYEP